MTTYTLEHEKIFFLYLVDNPKYYTKVDPSFFKESILSNLYKLVKIFFEKYSRVPSPVEIKLMAKSTKKFSFDEDEVALIFETSINNYDEESLKDNFEAWCQWINLKGKLVKSYEYIQTAEVTNENVQTIINKVVDIVTDVKTLSFSDNFGLNFFDAKSHQIKDDSRISSGHNWIDFFTNGGYSERNLVIYAGPPNVGKSIFLANDVASFVKRGYHTLLVTLEMGECDFIERIGSNLLEIPISEYEETAKDPVFISRKLSKLNDFYPVGTLSIRQFPTSALTVPELESYIKNYEQVNGIKLKVLVLDYLNIMANYRNLNSENMYMKLKQISEDLRAMAIRNDILIITAVQINREGSNTSELQLNHIAESAGIIHTADAILGIIQDSTMYLNNEYFLKLLKVRKGKGKNSKCHYQIDYNYMRLKEGQIIEQSF